MVWLGSFHWLLCNMFHWLHMVCCNVALHSTNSRRLLRQSSKLPQHEERADNALPRSKEAHDMRAICAHVRVLRDIMAQCYPR